MRSLDVLSQTGLVRSVLSDEFLEECKTLGGQHDAKYILAWQIDGALRCYASLYRSRSTIRRRSFTLTPSVPGKSERDVRGALMTTDNLSHEGSSYRETSEVGTRPKRKSPSEKDFGHASQDLDCHGVL